LVKRAREFMQLIAIWIERAGEERDYTTGGHVGYDLPCIHIQLFPTPRDTTFEGHACFFHAKIRHSIKGSEGHSPFKAV
jgi:hypothetical protein